MSKNSPSLGKIERYDPPPTLRLDEDDLPAMADWSVGKEYTLTVKVKLIAMRHGDEYAEMRSEKTDNSVSGTFKVLSVDSPDSKKVSYSRSDKLSRISEKAKD